MSEHEPASPILPVAPGEIKDHLARKRGMLKIFLGMAPGVGKTYTMLSEAHRRVSRGEDLVVGIVETHGRTDTAGMVAGLETVPRKRVEYRGRVFEEMDTAAVIARRPQWALVDELAHTNVPGSEHPKRWQSIQDILDAGINVISTVNVQHLESLNDEVLRITGIHVRETFPDRLLDDADEVVLVDLTPSALINRLKRGAVYGEDKVPAALGNFFTPENLAALRELALSRTAEEVDEQIAELTTEAHPLRGADAVLVCVTSRPDAPRLVRRGYRMAERLRGKLFCLHVQSAGTPMSAEERLRLDGTWELARDLGGHVSERHGESIAAEIVDFAREKRITLIVLGQSVRTRFDEIVRGSVVARIMRETAGVDVLIVADPEKPVER